MHSNNIAYKIAWIQCKHKKIGTEPCVSCVKQFQRTIDDDLGINCIIAAARYFEPKTRLDKITPLTWFSAYKVVEIVLRADRTDYAVSR